MGFTCIFKVTPNTYLATMHEFLIFQLGEFSISSTIWRNSTWIKFSKSVHLHIWVVHFELFYSLKLTSLCWVYVISYTKKSINQLIAEMARFLPVSWKMYKIVHVLFCQIGIDIIMNILWILIYLIEAFFMRIRRWIFQQCRKFVICGEVTREIFN